MLKPQTYACGKQFDLKSEMSEKKNTAQYRAGNTFTRCVAGFMVFSRLRASQFYCVGRDFFGLKVSE